MGKLMPYETVAIISVPKYLSTPFRSHRSMVLHIIKSSDCLVENYDLLYLQLIQSSCQQAFSSNSKKDMRTRFLFLKVGFLVLLEIRIPQPLPLINSFLIQTLPSRLMTDLVPTASAITIASWALLLVWLESSFHIWLCELRVLETVRLTASFLSYFTTPFVTTFCFCIHLVINVPLLENIFIHDCLMRSTLLGRSL